MPKSIDRDLLILINDVARLLKTRADQLARTRGMTRAQWIILARLARQPGLSQNEMAAVCEVEPITIARLVDRLEARGLIERRPDPTDRRIWRLHLLPDAKPIVAEIDRHRANLNAECAAGLDDKTKDFLIDTLLHLKANLTADGAPALAVGGK